MLIDELRTFLAVVDRRSFLRASEELRVARSTVRRRVADLEERLGHVLLDRGADGVAPTAAGERLVPRARRVVAEADQLVASAAGDDEQPDGRLVLAQPVGLPVLLPLMLQRVIASRYPKLTFEVRSRPEPVRELLAGADVAVAFGEPAEAGPWLRHEIGRVPQRLMATPDYLARHGTPRSVDDLPDHRLLLWQTGGETRPQLTTRGGLPVEVEPYYLSEHAHLVRALAAHGVGIAWALDHPLPEDDTERTQSRLVTVLGEEFGREVAVGFYVPSGRPGSARARVVADFVADLLGGVFERMKPS